jgi:hypothetical protein
MSLYVVFMVDSTKRISALSTGGSKGAAYSEQARLLHDEWRTGISHCV